MIWLCNQSLIWDEDFGPKRNRESQGSFVSMGPLCELGLNRSAAVYTLHRVNAALFARMYLAICVHGRAEGFQATDLKTEKLATEIISSAWAKMIEQ